MDPREVPPRPPDRIDEIIKFLSSEDDDTSSSETKTFKYKDGWDPDRLEEELQQHPFFMTKFPEPGEPVPPLLEAFQQLKYSETDNTPHDLALNHKEDGMYHFKLQKYRIASTCFTTAITHAMKAEKPDGVLLAQLYNNRAACMFYIENYRSCIRDCEHSLAHDPSYLKPMKRACIAAERIEKWAEVDKFAALIEDSEHGDAEIQFVLEKRKAVRKRVANERMLERRNAADARKVEESQRALVEAVKQRGIKLADEGFVKSEAAGEGNTPVLEDGVLHWPVLFLYPQYSQSDLVKRFSEQDDFVPHLYSILDADPPSWDADHEYLSDNVELYFLSNTSTLTHVPKTATLGDTLKSESFTLPSNGVPCFFVLAATNEFCNVFRERVEG